MLSSHSWMYYNGRTNVIIFSVWILIDLFLAANIKWLISAFLSLWSLHLQFHIRMLDGFSLFDNEKLWTYDWP